jgi:hypothetical protein
MSKTLTDASYEVVGHLERSRKWLPFLLMSCLAFAFIGIAVNAFGLILFSNQKGDIFDLKTMITSVNIVICSLFLLIGANQYLFLKRYKDKVRELEVLEEKIYQEVFRSKH